MCMLLLASVFLALFNQTAWWRKTASYLLASLFNYDMVSVCVIITIKVFFKCKTLSLETILSAHTHKGTRRHKHSDYTKLESAVGEGGACTWMFAAVLSNYCLIPPGIRPRILFEERVGRMRISVMKCFAGLSERGQIPRAHVLPVQWHSAVRQAETGGERRSQLHVLLRPTHQALQAGAGVCRQRQAVRQQRRWCVQGKCLSPTPSSQTAMEVVCSG